MKIRIQVDSNQMITAKHKQPDRLSEKDKLVWSIEVDGYEDPPIIDGKIYKEFYRNGKIEVEYIDVPTEELTSEEQIKKLTEQNKELNSRLTLTEGALTDMALMILS